MLGCGNGATQRAGGSVAQVMRHMERDNNRRSTRMTAGIHAPDSAS
jgi:hypothetical protein